MISRYSIFCMVVEMQSFTRVAHSLGYTQSAVSQMIKSLEKDMGTSLIERRRDGLMLTRDGREYLPYFSAVAAAERGLDKKRSEMNGLKNQTIRIGTFTSVSRNLLPQLMKGFSRRYPSVHYELKQGEYTSITQWIMDGSVDLGFLGPDKIAGVQQQTLYKDEMMAVLPEDHPLAAKETVTLKDLESEPFILLDEGDDSVPLRAFEKAGLSPRIEYKVTDDYSILAMVRQGLGVSMIYQMVLPGFTQHLAVRPVREAPSREVSLAWRDQQTLPLAARRFSEYLIKNTPEDLPSRIALN